MVSADHHEMVAERVAEELIGGAMFEANLDLCATEIWLVSGPEDVALGEPQTFHPVASDSNDRDRPTSELAVHAHAAIGLVVRVESEIRHEARRHGAVG